MELRFPSIQVILAFLIVLFMVAKKLGKGSRNQNRNSKLPPGPNKLPLIGNLHNMIGKQPHHTLRDLAKKYGPLMHLQLGQVSTVVVSSPKVAEQFLKTHELIFATRPEILSAEIMSYGYSGIIFTPYGNYWRQLRKIVSLEVLSTKRVQLFRYIREEEVSNLIKKISSTAGSPINLSALLYPLSNDIISRAAFGKKCKDKEAFISSIQEAITLSGGFEVGYFFPSLKFLRLVDGKTRAFERAHQKLSRILENIIDDHRVNKSLKNFRTADEMVHDQLKEDLVDVLLQIQESGVLEFPITIDNIKAVILDMFAGGTDTSAIILEWAMSEILKNPRVMEKVQAEVRQVFNGKRSIDETDIHKLDYLKLVIKETLRLHPAAPLLPRECRETCEISRFEIPKKTKLIVNAWAIGRDQEYWSSDAESFKPERFDGCSIDYKGTNFEYLPFGAGRRMCPGVSYGIANIELALAQLLYHFDWKLPNGIKPEDLDMSEALGATVRRRNDLYLIPIPYFNNLASTA